MSSFVIKLIAIISMIADHSSDVFIGQLSVLNLIGRIAFPLFSFQLVVGYTYTKDIKKYITRMLIFALISQIPYSIFMHIYERTYFALNIFFTLTAGLFCMYIITNKNIKLYLKIIYIAIILALSYYLKFDYSIIGILYTLFIFIFYPFQDKFGKNRLKINSVSRNSLFFLAGTLTFSIIKYVNLFSMLNFVWIFSLIFFTFIPSIIMMLFNGKKGPAVKYFFYAFYPVHLLILDLAYYIFIK